ncbi:TPA: hypothetical protein I8149_001894 [Citrobacter freundii]|nr:hypothetical protein [Citrobacter freundii]HAT2485002.1 hypothetical protein [Citrobacter freundii]HAT2719937.1 hypothetical protein [Citrobacter freundii]HAT2730026.1 hypothetical protein [Citrobacter freundii]HBC0512626.1 hypothetical protein [Citrobacter freundii]
MCSLTPQSAGNHQNSQLPVCNSNACPHAFTGYRDGDKQPRKSSHSNSPIPPIGPRVLRVNTTVRKWHCIWCDYRYYGTKQCPLCSEWTYTLEDNG